MHYMMAVSPDPFAVTVVRVQHERQHTVVDTGIYSVVRHPMYAGNPLVNVGLGLWLGSYAAVLFAAIPLGLLMVRIRLEERFCSANCQAIVSTQRVCRTGCCPDSGNQWTFYGVQALATVLKVKPERVRRR